MALARPNAAWIKPSPTSPSTAASFEASPQKPNISEALERGDRMPTSARPADCAEPRLRPDSTPANRNTYCACQSTPSTRCASAVSPGVCQMARIASIHSSSVIM